MGPRWLLARAVPLASRSRRVVPRVLALGEVAASCRLTPGRWLAWRRAASSASSSSSLQTRQGGGELQEGTGTALGDIAAKSSFLPRPEAFEEEQKRGFKGGRALFIFFLCNAVPFTGLLYYFSNRRAEKAQLSLTALPRSAGDVAAEALRVIRTASTCFFQRHGDASGEATLVDPHPPEGSAQSPPTEPLTLVPNMERNAFTDILESPSSSGLGFVHFALSRNSTAGKAILSGDRQAHLLYISPTRGAYCTVSGQLSVLSDPDSRRRYWKSWWAFSFAPPESTSSSAPVVSTAPQSQQAPEAPPAWSTSDYLLVRLGVSEVSLHSMVESPQRWHSPRVRRSDDAAIGSGEGWAFVAAS